MSETFPRPGIDPESPEAWLTEEEADTLSEYHDVSDCAQALVALASARREVHDLKQQLALAQFKLSKADDPAQRRTEELLRKCLTVVEGPAAEVEALRALEDLLRTWNLRDLAAVIPEDAPDLVEALEAVDAARKEKP